MPSTPIGLDFGTTNSVAAVACDNGAVETVSFDRPDGPQDTFPSVLTFWQEPGSGIRPETRVEGGPWAIDAFRQHAPDCRYLRSIKSLAGNEHFSETWIYGARYGFDDLMRLFVSRMKSHSQAGSAWHTGRLVIGRPIRFAGVSADAGLAIARYRSAIAALGFSEMQVVLEPLAAAYYFVQSLSGSARIFVADLGGGTSDFSIIEVSKTGGRTVCKPLASCGLDIAGDRFDYRIIDNIVSPILGKGSEYRSFGKSLTVPNHFYSRLARWNEISTLRSRETLRELETLMKSSLEPGRLDKFIRFVETEGAYGLHTAVSDLKRQLSADNTADFQLQFDGETIEATVTRKGFDTWIDPELVELDRLIDQTLAAAGVAPTEIDTVFLTGGTSFVPAVRGLFEHRFGNAVADSRDQLVSIANGLALIGNDGDEAAWMIDQTIRL